MKRCTNCDSSFTSEEWKCPACETFPSTVGAFPQFAPSFADSGAYYPTTSYDDLLAVEQEHFWFKARRDLVVWLLQTYFPDSRSLLDAGCGTGTTLAAIQWANRQHTLHGCDLNPHALNAALSRLPKVGWFQADICDLPYRSEFDVVLALDVIEHLDNEAGALRSIGEALKPGGGLVLAVPQHPFLWSRFDEAGCHRRRYTERGLRRQLEASGFRVLRSLSYAYLLFPLLVSHRWLDRFLPRQNFNEGSELFLRPWLNRILTEVMRTENCLTRSGLSCPFGGSLVVVARRMGS